MKAKWQQDSYGWQATHAGHLMETHAEWHWVDMPCVWRWWVTRLRDGYMLDGGEAATLAEAKAAAETLAAAEAWVREHIREEPEK